MQRLSSLKTGVTAGGLAALGISAKPLLVHIPPHNFDHYEFGAGPAVADRLYQVPFSADHYPSWNVAWGLTPSTLRLTTGLGDQHETGGGGS